MWKRNAVVATVVLFVCVALYLSWSYSRNASDDPGDPDYLGVGASLPPSSNPVLSPSANLTSQEPVKDDFFTKQRLDRQKARDNALQILKDLAETNQISDADRTKTNAEISNLATQALMEAKIEGLVIAKGFADCMAYINEGGISVIVAPPGGGLTATDVVKIQDVVVTETGFSLEKVFVQEAQAN